MISLDQFLSRVKDQGKVIVLRSPAEARRFFETS
jgi:hypothetical protein